MRVSSCLTDHGEIGIIVDQVDQTTSDHFVVVNEKHRDHNCSPLPPPLTSLRISHWRSAPEADYSRSFVTCSVLKLQGSGRPLPLGPSMSTDEHLEDYY